MFHQENYIGLIRLNQIIANDKKNTYTLMRANQITANDKVLEVGRVLSPRGSRFKFLKQSTF